MEYLNERSPNSAKSGLNESSSVTPSPSVSGQSKGSGDQVVVYLARRSRPGSCTVAVRRGSRPRHHRRKEPRTGPAWPSCDTVTPGDAVTCGGPDFLSTSTPSSRRGMIRVWSRQELCRRAPAGGLILEMDVCQRGSVAVADDGSGFGLRGGPGRREAALGQAQGLASAVRSAFRSDRSASPGHSVWYPQGS
jgi:hypothetical protein